MVSSAFKSFLVSIPFKTPESLSPCVAQVVIELPWKMCNAVLENFVHVNEIKSYLRDSEFNDHDLIVKLQHIEDKLMNQHLIWMIIIRSMTKKEKKII